MPKPKTPPWFVVPAQPVLQRAPPIGPGWVHEIKHDGYRLLIRKDGDSVRLFTRNGFDWSSRFPLILAAAAALTCQSCTIDGEAVVLGPDGLSQFYELRTAEGSARAVLYAFDLLERDGADLRRLPLLDRKQDLADLLRSAAAGIRLNEHISADGRAVFEHACRLGAEGIVSKQVDSPYRSGPYPAWVKVKNPAAVAEQRKRSEAWRPAGQGS